MNPAVPLGGRVALITGASGAFGGFFADRLAASGARVVLGARRADSCERLCDTLRSRGDEAVSVALDVTVAESARAAIEAAVRAFGRLDILVNNAGIGPTAPLMDLADSTWDDVLDTNVKGAFLVGQAAARVMSQSGGGAIVNVASILGLRVAGQVAAYAASKAALIQLTRSMALEWARHDIRVNALCPGYIETDLNRAFFATEPGQAMVRRIPQRRLGRLDDLEGPLLLLCSDAGAYMTGATIAVDGGHLVSSL